MRMGLLLLRTFIVHEERGLTKLHHKPAYADLELEA